MAQPSSTFTAVSGDGYELQMGRWSRRLAVRFLDFAGLEDAGSVLDAGCGTGALSSELLARTEKARIVGIDLSAAYIAHARDSLSDPRIRFEIGDLIALPFADGEFDHVYSQLVLQFVPDSRRAVGELVRVTRPGGKVSAAVWDSRGGLIFYRLFVDTAAMLDPGADAFRKRTFTRPLTRPGELASAWEAAGLVDCRPGEITIRTAFASFDDYWAPLDVGDGPIPAYLQSVTKETRSGIKAAVRRAYLDGDEDGPRSYAATAWVATGTKPTTM
ncbi:MAG: class I SAM-dependent methyltransferase [Pseudomonadota bacterium]